MHELAREEYCWTGHKKSFADVCGCQSEVSAMVEECVRQLARKHRNTRFVKLHFEDAEMEPAGVPAVLAYRAGDKFAGLVPVVDEIPDDADLSSETLEVLFQRYVILPQARLEPIYTIEREEQKFREGPCES